MKNSAIFSMSEIRRMLLGAAAFAACLGVAGGALADGDRITKGTPFGEVYVVKDPIQLKSDCNAAEPYAGISLKLPKNGLTFAEIKELSTSFNVANDDCGGGSPRFSIGLDTDNNGSRNGNLFVYLGPHPNFVGCAPGWQNSGNLTENTETRFDTGQLGGTFYDSYANALTNFGSADVLGISLVVDSCWMASATKGDDVQAILVQDISLNGKTVKTTGNDDDDD